MIVVTSLLPGCVFPGCNPPFPQSHTCAAPAGAGHVDAVEIGAPTLNGAPEDPFVPFAAGDPICIQRGGQGATMIQVRLRLHGASQSCVEATVAVADAAQPLTHNHSFLDTAAQPDGTRATGNIILPDAYPVTGTALTVSTLVYGVSAQVGVVLATDCPYLTGDDLSAVVDMSSTD